ncbi:MAG: hypothetical protein E7299_08915 [Lachnospiraceae bacterium]|nr:hypothetical protein [Lachnospiraceae bacterium]
MKKIYAERLKKFISIFSVMILVLGMCFHVMETDSSFACIQSVHNAATLENMSSTIENVDISCPETIQRQETSSVKTNVRRSTRRYEVKEFLAGNEEAYMPAGGEKHIRQESRLLFVKCFDHIAILNFIHSQDGEK